jgi:hypothetical protein
MRFIDNGDDTVTDTETGLIWLKDAGKIGPLNWKDAKKACETIGMRLPTRNELLSLLDFDHCYPPLPEGHPFTSVQSGYYWSSTSGAGNTSGAWSVLVFFGYVGTNDKSNTYNVWPVKGEMK